MRLFWLSWPQRLVKQAAVGDCGEDPAAALSPRPEECVAGLPEVEFGGGAAETVVLGPCLREQQEAVCGGRDTEQATTAGSEGAGFRIIWSAE